MRALHHAQAEHHGNKAHVSLIKSVYERMSKVSEGFWFVVTFLLFLALGPFSVIAVVYGLWSLASAENRKKMTEPARC